MTVSPFNKQQCEKWSSDILMSDLYLSSVLKQSTFDMKLKVTLCHFIFLAVIGWTFIDVYHCMWQCVCTWSTSSFYQLNSTWPTYATWAVWCNTFLTYICKFVGKKKSQFWMFSPLYLEKSVITASSVQANSLMQPLNVDVKWPDVSSCTDFCPGNPPAKHQQC
jgi:hypothetical protein